jgi:hypothetical protein
LKILWEEVWQVFPPLLSWLMIYLLKPSFESRNDAIKCGRLSK